MDYKNCATVCRDTGDGLREICSATVEVFKSTRLCLDVSDVLERELRVVLGVHSESTSSEGSVAVAVRSSAAGSILNSSLKISSKNTIFRVC